MFLCACKCVHVCVRGIVCELCTCMCVMISLTWHHSSEFEAIYVACSIVRVNWARFQSLYILSLLYATGPPIYVPV